MLTPHSLFQESQGLYEWASRFIDRFPTLVDLKLLREVPILLGSTATSFFKERSTFHLKRLLLTNFFLKKTIKPTKKQQFHVRIFPIDSRLCIAIAYSKGENILVDDTILEIVSQKVPALEKVDLSSYHWMCQDLPYSLCYVELEKKRGARLTFVEIKNLENYLKKQLYPYTTSPSVFWPYNHEETFKQLLILEKEVSSPKDYPQVIINFQGQKLQNLEFLIHLVRPKKTISRKTRITAERFPPSVQLISHLKKEFSSKIQALAEAFSLIFPIHNFKSGSTVNLLYAREFTAKLLQDVVGIFRDYNGGLFETQKNQFEQLSKDFSKKIPNFSLFGKDLFYSLIPIEAQLCLSSFLFEKLFEGFSQSLSKKASFSIRANPYVLVLKTQDPYEFSSWTDQAKNLQEKGNLTAYASAKVSSESYLCLVDETGHSLDKIKLSRRKGALINLKRTLRLTFQEGSLSSFYPYYLAKESRGRTVASLLFEGLFRLNPKSEVEYAGCESFTLSKNKKRYLFKLRTHHWSNGERVTAFDYEKTWKRNFLAKENSNPFYILKHADAIRKKEKPLHSLGVRAVDDHLLQVDLEKEDPHLLEKFSHSLFFPSLEDDSETTSFNGPYCIREKTNRQLILEKNIYYWGKESLFFNQVLITFESSPKKITKLFKQGDIDWIGQPCTHDAKVPKPFFVKELSHPFFAHLNTKFLPLSSRFIRQALSCVLDRQFITQSIFPESRPLFSFLPTASLRFEPTLTDHDLTKGKELFEQGLKELSLTAKTFPPIKLISCKLEKYVRLSKYLQEKWQQTFGIQISLEIQDWNTFYQKLEQGSFHIGGCCNRFFPFDPISFLESFSYQENNFSGWEHKDYAQIIALAKKTTSKKAQKNCLFQAKRFLLDHMPTIPLLTPLYSYTHCQGLKNYIFSQDCSVDFRFASIQNRQSENLDFPDGQHKPLLNQSGSPDIYPCSPPR